MQEEMTQQSLALSFKAVEMTADLLYTALKTLLEDGEKLSKQRSKTKTPKIAQGKQSVKSLIGQGKGVESIDINSKNIGLFASSARKYGVDFAMTKDKSTEPPTHTIFFKGNDTAAITSAFKDFVGKESAKEKLETKKSLVKEIRKLTQEIKKKDISLDGKSMAKEMTKSHEQSL